MTKTIVYFFLASRHFWISSGVLSLMICSASPVSCCISTCFSTILGCATNVHPLMPQEMCSDMWKLSSSWVLNERSQRSHEKTQYCEFENPNRLKLLSLCFESFWCLRITFTSLYEGWRAWGSPGPGFTVRFLFGIVLVKLGWSDKLEPNGLGNAIVVIRLSTGILRWFTPSGKKIFSSVKSRGTYVLSSSATSDRATLAITTFQCCHTNNLNIF